MIVLKAIPDSRSKNIKPTYFDDKKVLFVMHNLKLSVNIFCSTISGGGE